MNGHALEHLLRRCVVTTTTTSRQLNHGPLLEPRDC